jgi:glyoxylase-like metal-dependent hydrolase (beta-lactamase superfamily II)
MFFLHPSSFILHPFSFILSSSMRIEKLSLPTPFPVGPINVYVIVEDPITLLDTGPKTEDALFALREQLRKLGLIVRDIQRIVLTHTHEDHCGLAGVLQRESGARVYVHEWEYQNISQHRQTRVNHRLLKQAGVPDEEAEEMAIHYQWVRDYADPVEDLAVYRDHEEFIFASGSLRVVHSPGHTPGSCCFFRESNRFMLTGDTILKTITPNPVLNPDPIDQSRRFPSLGEYLVSLARIRSLAPTLLLTSHGDDVTDYEEHFYRLIRHINQRQTKVIDSVPVGGITAWELSQLIFPGAESMNRFLAVSEAIAHLDLAVADGKLGVERKEEIEVFIR